MTRDGFPATTDIEFFKVLCDAAETGIIAVNKEMLIGYANPTACEILATSPELLEDRTLSELLGENDHASAVNLAVTDALTGKSVRFELAIPNGDDCRRLAVSVSPIGNVYEPAEGALLTMSDITDVLDNHDKGSHSRKMLALGNMAGNIAHYFNNILGGIVTSIDFARGSNDVRVLKRTMNSAADAMQRASRLLEGLLAFAEADYRDDDLADLTETILYFVDRIEPQLLEREIELQLYLNAVPVVAVPRKNLLMALSNIGQNAIDAMGPGGTLTIELFEDDRRICCRLSDSGPGIPTEQIQHVFEPFFSTKRDIPGCSGQEHPGLGLSVAIGMIHEMGGDIEIESAPGKLTRVEVSLPMPSHAVR